MDFFQSQEVARRKSATLVVYFALAVILIIAAVYVAFLLIFIGADIPHDEFLKGRLLLYVSGVTLAVVLVGSLYKMAQLNGGGETVARGLGGVPVNPGTTDASERRLLNVVEEMAIAAGTPVPPVYLLPEEGINAFAAGFSPSDAVIGVTRGTVRRLTRDELQGVIGHEFSHILNGDMRLNIRLMGFIFGILCLAVIGRVLLRTRGKKNPLPIFGLALLLVGYIGVFFGKLIQSAVSRQREFLADASAVQFTRNPDGIAGALKKIGGLDAGSRLRTPAAEEASHMFFANGMGRAMVSLMATHPPLEERIKRITPSFTGEFSAAAPLAEDAGDESIRPPPLQPSPHTRPPALPPHLAVAGLMASIGAPQAEHVAYAADLLSAIPPDVRGAARDPIGARALLYALILAGDTAVRDNQLRMLRDGLDAEADGALQALLASVQALPARARLPVVDLAFAGLRRMTSAQYDALCAALLKLVEADDQIDLFEYALQHMIVRHLDPHFGRSPKNVPPSASLADITDAAADLFSTLAYYGHDDATDAGRAFAAGFSHLQTGAHRTIRPVDGCGLDLAGAALAQLSRAYPLVKKRIMEGCVAVVAADRQVRIEEAELLRAVADALGCPAPPLLPGDTPHN